MGHADRGHPQFNMGGDETKVRIAGFISYSTFISVAMTNTEHKMAQGIKGLFGLPCHITVHRYGEGKRGT